MYSDKIFVNSEMSPLHPWLKRINILYTTLENRKSQDFLSERSFTSIFVHENIADFSVTQRILI